MTTLRPPGLIVIAMCSIAGAAPVASAQILYVDDDAPPAGDGLTWATAYQSPQEALAVAAGGGVSEIHVAQGVYTPAPEGISNCCTPNGGMGCDDSDCESIICGGPLAICCGVAWDELCASQALILCDFACVAPRAETFQLLNGVVLAGGYAGVGAPDPDARDIALYETVLSGDLIGDDGPGPFDNNDENSYHVVTGSGTDGSAVLDGFTITAGHADGPADLDQHGAGMLNLPGSPTITNCLFTANRAAGFAGGLRNDGDESSQSSPTISNCAFVGNAAVGPTGSGAGGGMMNANGSSPTITDCTFTGNTTLADAGGGMANVVGSNPIVTNCTFNDNTSPVGAGMFNHSSDPIITNCTFQNNTATLESWGGGGMFNIESSSPTVTGCTFDANTTGYLGGGMFNDNNSDSWVVNCVFTSNTAGQAGGGMWNSFCSPVVEGCTFAGNSAPSGGGVEDFNAGATIANCLFVDNTATLGDYGGGGMLSSTNSSTTITGCAFCGNSADLGGGGGGMLTALDSTTTITNCTFTGNSAGYGGGIGTSDLNGGHSESVVNNTIAWGNTPDQISDAGGATTTVNYSDVEGSWAGAGANNIDADPLLVDTVDCDDLHLLPGSPCIDAASNPAVPAGMTTDLDGNPRLMDDPCTVVDTGLGDPPVVDMGAYEFQGTSCDLDGDGTVGIVDFLALLAAWGPCADCDTPQACPADFDGDCTVGILDLLLLLGNWG